ncbi:hypothetical protein [Phocaeicola plebeius]|jgi:hypothetical protein|uniref:hypothetical protein n=1 Tax=Phocaeicola plebeius TaxID=310297 RepID=UPI00241E71F3|nr:hypothetical protein [Phocaeicola plebeius]
MKKNFNYILTALLFCLLTVSCQDNDNWRIIPYEPEPEAPLEGPAELRIAGDQQGWNPAAEVIGKLYPVKNDEGEMAGDYAGYVYLNSQFKICPNASWDGAYGVGDDTPAGSMTVGDGLANLTVSEPGYYYVKCNIDDLTWSADVVNFGIIGSATPGQWDEDTDLVYDETDLKLKVTITLTDGEIKFRANDAWNVPNGDFGAGEEEGKLAAGAGNIAVSAGTYQIVVDLSTPDYSYEMIAQ